MWSRVKFILGTNPAIEGKSKLIYKAWYLSKLKVWQENNNLKRETYGKEFDNTELSVLDEEIGEARDNRYKKEIFEYESLVILGLIEACIFEFHDKDGYIKNRFYLNRTNVLSESYNEDMIDEWFANNQGINYITAFYQLNEDTVYNFLNQHILFSKDDKTIVHVGAQLIMFTLQFSRILYHLNELHKEFGLRRFEFDASIYPEYIDWFSCLLYLEIAGLIEIETWGPKVLSTDKINPLKYIKIKKQEEFRKMVQGFMELDLKDIERKEKLTKKQEKTDGQLILKLGTNSFISHNGEEICIRGEGFRIIKKFYDSKSETIKLSKSICKNTTEDAFNKMLTRFRDKIKPGKLKLEKITIKGDKYILRKDGHQ